MARKKIEVGAGLFNSQEGKKQENVNIKETETGEIIMQRSYYITKKQYAALKKRAAETVVEDTKKDMSYHVRAALEEYLFNK